MLFKCGKYTDIRLFGLQQTFDVSRLVEYIPSHNADSGVFRAWVQSAEELFIRHLTTLV